MKNKIVMDSSGDINVLPGVAFASVPLTIQAGERSFEGNDEAVVEDMISHLKSYTGTTTSACPSIGQYLDAFEDAEQVYCFTITSQLSGSYNAAVAAAKEFLLRHPDRKIHVFDTLSTGPEMLLLAEKLRDLLQFTDRFEEIVSRIQDYQRKTRLIFSLESLRNLANNGRVPAVVSKAVGMLGIRLIGKASQEGTLQPTGKVRGEKKLIPGLMKELKALGYHGGKIRIAHCHNESAAKILIEHLKEQFPSVDVSCYKTGGLCSFYAEEGGLLIGFETA